MDESDELSADDFAAFLWVKVEAVVPLSQLCRTVVNKSVNTDNE